MNLVALAALAVLSMGNSNKDSDEMKLCTADVKQCPDGSFVARDPAKNCQFKPCPGEKSEEGSACTIEAESCSSDN